MPVEKGTEDSVDFEREASTSVSDSEVIHRRNILLGGTSVSAGEGRAVVVQTGDSTYVGALSAMLGEERPLNAFDKSVRNVAYLLIGFMAIMVPIVFVIQGTTNQDAGWKVSCACSSREGSISPLTSPCLTYP